jgi:hypothetical protein
MKTTAISLALTVALFANVGSAAAGDEDAIEFGEWSVERADPDPLDDFVRVTAYVRADPAISPNTNARLQVSCHRKGKIGVAIGGTQLSGTHPTWIYRVDKGKSFKVDNVVLEGWRSAVASKAASRKIVRRIVAGSDSVYIAASARSGFGFSGRFSLDGAAEAIGVLPCVKR